MILMYIFTVISALFWIFYLIVNKNLKYWKNRNVPYVEPEFFYGNSRGISKDYHPGELWREMYLKLKHHGPIGGAYLFIKPFAVITDLDLLKTIMIKDFNFFSNRVAYFNETDDPLSAHVINLEGEPWKKMRNKISPIFASNKLKIMFETLATVSSKLIDVIDKETANDYPMEVGDVLSRFVTDVLGSTEFGIDCNALEDKKSKFYEMALKDFASFSFLKRILLGTFRDLGRRLHLSTTDKEIAAFYTDVLEKTIKFRKQNPHVRREDLMSLLIKLKNSSGSEALNFNQIAAQTYVFSVAGKYKSFENVNRFRKGGFHFNSKSILEKCKSLL